MKIRILHIAISLIVCIYSVHGQELKVDNKRDSLLHLFQSTIDKLPTTEEKTEFLIKKLNARFYTLSRKAVLEFVDKVEGEIDRGESESVQYLWKLIDAYRYENENRFEDKISVLYECYDYYKATPGSSYFLQANYQLGELFFRTSKYESGLRHLREVFESLPGVQHPKYSIVTRKLARNYANLGQEKIGLDLMTDLISKYEARENFKWDRKHARHYMVKALILNKMGRTAEAIQTNEAALIKIKELDDIILLNNCKSGLARYYLSANQIAKAKKNGIEAFNHYEILKVNYPSMTESRLTLGRIYFAEGNYEESKRYFQLALETSRIHHRLLDESDAINGIISCNIKMEKDMESTYKQFESYKNIRDSLFNTDMANAVQDVQVKYETEEKENYIKSLNKQKLLVEESLRIAERNNILLGFLLLLLLLSALVVARLYNNRARSQKLLAQKNEFIEDSLEEKKLLLKEIHHRVKNNLQTVSSLLSLQSNFITDEKVLDALKDGQNRVQSMALIHQNLYQENDLKNIRVKSYYEKLIDRLYQSYDIDKDRIQLITDIDDILIDIDRIISLGLIANELIINVFKYAFPDDANGVLFVALKKDENKISLTIKDNGKGLNPKVLSDQNNSFGYQMVKAFCQKLDAVLSVNPENGTEINITIENIPSYEKSTNSRR